MTSESRRRKPGDILVAVIGIVAAVWFTYWYLANQMAFLAIDSVLSAAGRSGYTAECASKFSRGFPLKFDAGCGALRFTDRETGAMVVSPGFSVTTPLYWPLQIKASAASPASVTPHGDAPAVRANWSNASARVDGGFRGLYGGEVQLDKFDLAGSIDIPHLPLTGLTADTARLALAPSPTKPGDYGLSATLGHIRTTTADARTIPDISASAQLTAFGLGNSLGLSPGGTYAAWAEKGGKAQLDQLLLTIGPMTITASGPLTVSPEGLVSGKVTVRFVNLDQLPAIIEAFQPGSRSAAAFAKLLMVVTRKVETPAGPARETVLNLSEGNLFFGILPIGKLPPLML